MPYLFIRSYKTLHEKTPPSLLLCYWICSQNNQISKLRNLVCITQLVTEKALINRNVGDQPKVFSDVDDSTDVFQMLTSQICRIPHLPQASTILGARVPVMECFLSPPFLPYSRWVLEAHMELSVKLHACEVTASSETPWMRTRNKIEPVSDLYCGE